MSLRACTGPAPESTIRRTRRTAARALDARPGILRWGAPQARQAPDGTKAALAHFPGLSGPILTQELLLLRDQAFGRLPAPAIQGLHQMGATEIPAQIVAVLGEAARAVEDAGLAHDEGFEFPPRASQLGQRRLEIAPAQLPGEYQPVRAQGKKQVRGGRVARARIAADMHGQARELGFDDADDGRVGHDDRADARLHGFAQKQAALAPSPLRHQMIVEGDAHRPALGRRGPAHGRQGGAARDLVLPAIPAVRRELVAELPRPGRRDIAAEELVGARGDELPHKGRIRSAGKPRHDLQGGHAV